MRYQDAFLLVLSGIIAPITILAIIVEWLFPLFHKWLSKHEKDQDNLRKTHHRDSYANIKKGYAMVISARINAVADQLEAQKQQQKTQDKERAFREKITFFAAAAAAIFTGISVCIFEKQLHEMRLDKRPWISANATIASDLTYVAGFEPMVQISFKFTLQNTGESPARNIHIIPRINSSVDGLAVSSEIACTPPKNGSGVYGVTLFPKDATGDITFIIGTGLGKMKILGAVSPIKYHLFLVYCIVYQTANTEEWHRTPATFVITLRTEPFEFGQFGHIFVMDGTPISADKLMLAPYPINYISVN